MFRGGGFIFQMVSSSGETGHSSISLVPFSWHLSSPCSMPGPMPRGPGRSRSHSFPWRSPWNGMVTRQASLPCALYHAGVKRGCLSSRSDFHGLTGQPCLRGRTTPLSMQGHCPLFCSLMSVTWGNGTYLLLPLMGVQCSWGRELFNTKWPIFRKCLLAATF